MPEIRTDVGIPMRDGTVLGADVHLPDALPAPVLVTRTAYGKHTGIALTADTAALVARGYAVVVQDKRGLHASDGRWRIMRDDRQDGHDTVEWAAAQPWSDGRVGVYGLSYLGHTAMSAAIARPPHLAAAVVMQPSTDEYSDRTFLDGVLALQNDVDWPALPFVAPALIAGLPAEERAGAEADLAAHLTGDVRYGALPLADRPYLARFPELWAGPLAHREDAGYFADTRVGAAELARVDVPVLHVGSWFDLFVRNTVRQFELAAGVSPRGAEHRLVLGPWAHSQLTADSIAGRVFPDAPTDAAALVADWAGRWTGRNGDGAGGRGAGAAGSPPVAIVYVLGADRWRAEPAWPIRGTEIRALALQPDGTADFGPARGGERVFAYDPAEPYTAPSVTAGPQDPTAHQGGRNVLVYETGPILAPLEATGWPRAVLHAATTGTDADWFVELDVVGADGAARIVNEGVARSRYRHGRGRPTATEPGRVETITVHLRPMSIELQPGERLRVVVTGGKFPVLEHNPGAFIDPNTATEADYVPSVRTIASASLELPVVPAAARGEWIANPWPLGAR